MNSANSYYVLRGIFCLFCCLAAMQFGCKPTVTLTVAVEPDGSGVVLREPDKEIYKQGDQVTLTAMANAGYEFDRWSGDWTGKMNPEEITLGGSLHAANENLLGLLKNTVASFTINEDMEITAHFVPVSIVEGEGEIILEGEGEMPAEGEGEAPVEGEGEAPVEGEGEAPVEGEGEAPVEGEGEVPVEGEGEAPVEGEGEVLPEGEGEVPVEGEGEAPVEGEGEVLPEGEGEEPNEGEGELPSYTLTYTADEGGSIEGPALQTVNHGEDGVEVTAVASEGYYFTEWSDGVSSAARQDTNVTADISVTAYFDNEPVVIETFTINDGASLAMDPMVILHLACGGWPVEYMASESPTFEGASWLPFEPDPVFMLRGGVGQRTVYVKTRNSLGESEVLHFGLFLGPMMVQLEGCTFTMGRRTDGDDALGSSAETPQHDVSLGGYLIGTVEVSNQQFCDVLNWAKGQNRLYRSDYPNVAWGPGSNIAAGGSSARNTIFYVKEPTCDIEYNGAFFAPKTRAGKPDGTQYSMAEHPVVQVTWFGAIAFCNWLSEMQGVTPCYDMNTQGWPLSIAPPAQGGYRLPTEAEWERAAAWDGFKHWIYGFTSDTLTGKDRAVYLDENPDYVNPLGLTQEPYTAPVAWFNGRNVSPNGDIATVNSVSPVGCYDMCGNVREWTHDWYSATYYTDGGPVWMNPLGPASGTYRVTRGGSYAYYRGSCRSAIRVYEWPSYTNKEIGFRVARS